MAIAACLTTRGIGPMTHISIQRRDRARHNIQIKINILSGWIMHGVPKHPTTGLAEYFPTTLRQFKAWDGLLNSEDLRLQLPSIARIGNDTLDANQDLKASASSIIALLKARSVCASKVKQASASNKEQAQVLLKLLNIRNSELVSQQREIRRLKSQIQLLERRLEVR